LQQYEIKINPNQIQTDISFYFLLSFSSSSHVLSSFFSSILIQTFINRSGDGPTQGNLSALLEFLVLLTLQGLITCWR
jgi:hypothetical protein